MEKDLTLKFLTDSISNQELQILKDWIEENHENQIIFKSYVKDYLSLNLVIQNPNLDAAYKKVWEKIQSLPNEKQEKQRRVSFGSFIRYAAVFVGIIFFGLGAYVVYLRLDKQDNVSEATSVSLKLSDGTIQVLNENETQVINTSSGEVLANQQKNILSYNDSIQSSGQLSKPRYNELIVPYGKKFQLALSDGTHVFLNSGSRLKYPTRFLAHGPREVFLDGEAFFSVVKKGGHQFRVVTDEMTTMVTGTKFNVSSYKNEKNTSTVLVEGSVNVVGQDLDDEVGLDPGQRAVIENDNISVDHVNIEKHIAWTKNQLFFVDDRFELIIKELERHYNVTIKSEVTFLNRTLFTGTFETETLIQILNTFQKHTSFDYEKNGDVILIKQNK